MSRRLKDFDDTGMPICEECKLRPITTTWPGSFCDKCGREYYVRIWTYVCATADSSIDPAYPEDIERLKHATYNLARFGEKVPIQAVQMLRKLGVEVSDLVREYGGAA